MTAFQDISHSLRQLYLEDERPWLVGFSGAPPDDGRLQATDPASAEVPSGWLTPSVLDNCGTIGYNWVVRSDKALRACRVRYARKSSFVFGSCLWFLLPSAVRKSRSAKARAGTRTQAPHACKGEKAEMPPSPTNRTEYRLNRRDFLTVPGGTKRECL